MEKIKQKYTYICENCGTEYYFYEKLLELECEICGDMVIKDA